MKDLCLPQRKIAEILNLACISRYLPECRISVAINNSSNFKNLTDSIGVNAAALNTLRSDLSGILTLTNSNIEIINIEEITNDIRVLYYDIDFKISYNIVE